MIIEATPQECFDAVVDYETFPEWQKAVRSCRVLARDPDGRGREVAIELDASARPIHYVVDCRYEEPHLVVWRYLEGDVDGVDGEFVFEDRGDGTTLATYALRSDPGRGLPGKAARALSEQVTQGAVEDLKRRVER